MPNNRLLLSLIGAIVILVACASGRSVFALPPLGLIEIDSVFFADLEIINGTAYTSAPGGVQTVSAAGDLGFISISHPTLTPLVSTTRAVKASDGGIYVAATFGTFQNPAGAALYNLQDPAVPIVTWQSARARSVDSMLRTFGNLDDATIFHLDGSSETLPYPPGSDSSNNSTTLTSATPKGYAFGEAGIPGTIGIAPLLWTPTGEFDSFVFGSGIASTIRDRQDGHGINAGNDSGEIQYGANSSILIRDTQGFYLAASWTVVSQSQFAVLYNMFEPDLPIYAYYPGIVPGFPDRAVPLLDIFPELASIDIDTIHDLASVDGYVYMTLSGADGTFLFGARDPSVAVPEPATAILFAIVAMPWLLGRRDL